MTVSINARSAPKSSTAVAHVIRDLVAAMPVVIFVTALIRREARRVTS